MTKIKICGLFRDCDIDYVNILMPEYAGFVFFEKSKRYITPKIAKKFKMKLNDKIKAVGVFVNEQLSIIAEMLNCGIIDIVQLHGNENELYISNLRKLTEKPLIKAFKISTKEDVFLANASTADFVLLDNGEGTGNMFDWSLIEYITRPFFLAGGISTENISSALKLSPFAIDVSSGVETEGVKDFTKINKLICLIRE
jgi:phosphoribosylanthranilate isomerase